MPRCVAVVAATLAALAAGGTTASAALRTASPGAGGDCVNSPCDIVAAINGAGANDDVVVTHGDYDVGATALSNSATNLNVHGVDGQPRPRILSTNADSLMISGAGSQVRHLEIDQSGPQLAFHAAFGFAGSLASDLVVRAAGQDANACTILGSATLRDTVCEAPGKDAGAISEFKMDASINAATFRNVTAFATGEGGIAMEAITGGTAGDTETITAVNSIFRGQPGHADLQASSGSGGPASIALQYSNYFFRSGNVTADSHTQFQVQPIFTAPGDYHQAPTSPTIDKGADNALNGQFDFDGDARVFRTTDIGADEFYPPPTVLTGPPAPIQTRGATLHGTVNPNSLATTYHFEFGTTTSYGSSTPAADAGTGTAGAPATAALTGLAPNTTYHYRLVATNPKGTSNGGDVSLTTLALTPPKKKVTCRVPKLKGLSLPKARRKLKAAHCRLGKVKRPKVKKRHGKRVRLVVKKQSPKAGKVLAKNSKVRVTLGPR
jgi:hypothetical protein